MNISGLMRSSTSLQNSTAPWYYLRVQSKYSIHYASLQLYMFNLLVQIKKWPKITFAIKVVTMKM